MTTENERKKASWSFDAEGIQTCSLPSGREVRFDLTRLFSDFKELTDTQQETVAYGNKRKCSDRTARSTDMKLDEDGIVEVMLDTFESIVDGTAWTRKGGGGQKSVKKQIVEGANKALNGDELAKLKELLSKSGISIF